MSEKNEFVKKTSYRKKRYFVYAIVSIISLVMPFIQINGNQLFLLSFDKKQFHLMGTAFDMQELYLMPFLLMLLFIGIFAITSIGGRAWCGWACPQTIFRVIYRDLIESTLLKLRRIKNNNFDREIALKKELENLENICTTNEKTIDQMVYKLYDLTPDEIKIIQGN